MRVQPRPRFRAGASVLFADFKNAVDASRELAQSGLNPANCRLLGHDEALMSGSGDGSQAILVLGFESADHELGPGWPGRWKSAPAIAGRPVVSGARESDPAAAWRASFLRGGHLRDGLVRLGLISETFETAVTWDRFWEFHEGVLAATRQAVRQACGGGVVSCRFAYVYPDGPSPYYSVFAPGRPGQELERWDRIKLAAAEAIAALGGTITHHHAVGRDRRRWYLREVRAKNGALRGAKAELDPAGIMNPGVLLKQSRRYAMRRGPFGIEPGRFPVPGRVHVPGQHRGRKWQAAVRLPGTGRTVVAARQRAAVGGPGQGRTGRDAAVQLARHARGPFRRARGGRNPRRGQQPPVQRRGRVHPAAQRGEEPAARHGARSGRRAARPGRGNRDPLRRHRRPRGPVRGVPGPRLAASVAGELAGARGGDHLDQLHLRDHGAAQGGAVHLPRRVPERAERGDRGRPGHRLGLPVDAADVPLQRLVLPVGGHRGRGAPRDDARGGPRPHLGADRPRGGHALQRGPDRPADGRQPSPGAPPGAAGDGDGGRRPALPDAAGPDVRAQLPRRARVRPDRDLRPDHRVPRAGSGGASSPRNSARGRWRARGRPTRRPIWSVSSTSR